MLIRQEILERIMSGEIDLQFRRWRRPTVRSGGTLRTRLGLLEIARVQAVTMASLTAADAHRAGYPSKRALIDHLRERTTGRVYRIEVAPGGEDPLVAMRADVALTEDDIRQTSVELARIDDRSLEPWTIRYLTLIQHQPHVRAEDLAAGLGMEKPAFKARVRRLKALGLTVSHSPGYALSPRGEVFLARRKGG